jgi:two-component system response regulator HydG
MDNDKGTILIVDDELNALKVLSAILSAEGFLVIQASSVDEAIAAIKAKLPDTIITDMKMPGKSGLDLFKFIKTNHPGIPVIFLTAYGTVESAVNVLTAGAFHYFVKPPDYRELIRVLVSAVELGRLKREMRSLQTRLDDESRAWLVLGNSPAMKRIHEIIETVRDSVSNVLVAGETGTGKELIARALHFTSKRHQRPFVAVNCAAIPRELIEAELFGHEKGAFTGAAQRRVGRIEAAAGGTLFLDEISELDISVQSKLLRVLQEKEFSRLGDNAAIEVDFRLIASTNRDLRSEIARGTFREDLFYRINVVDLRIPPLRERREDIRLLAMTFFKEFCLREGKSLALSEGALQVLESYPWPGNVRELKNAMERVVVLSKSRLVTEADFPAEIFADRLSGAHTETILSLKELELRTVREVLARCGGNKSRAALKLGLSRKALYKRIRDYQLE